MKCKYCETDFGRFTKCPNNLCVTNADRYLSIGFIVKQDDTKDDLEIKPNNENLITGWQCPVCKNVWAMWVDRCRVCEAKNKTDYGFGNYR